MSAPVGGFSPNGFGLHDMLGNIWEWVEDTYSSDAYGKHSRQNPIYTRESSSRVVRGGSWDYGPGGVRCADRLHSSSDNRSGNLGFRLRRRP